MRPEISDNVLQIFDQQGRQFPWSGGGDYQAAGPGVTARLTLCPEGAVPISEPTSSRDGRLEAIARVDSVSPPILRAGAAVVQARVEFADIPLP